MGRRKVGQPRVKRIIILSQATNKMNSYELDETGKLKDKLIDFKKHRNLSAEIQGGINQIPIPKDPQGNPIPFQPPVAIPISKPQVNNNYYNNSVVNLNDNFNKNQMQIYPNQIINNGMNENMLKNPQNFPKVMIPPQANEKDLKLSKNKPIMSNMKASIPFQDVQTNLKTIPLPLVTSNLPINSFQNVPQPQKLTFLYRQCPKQNVYQQFQPNQPSAPKQFNIFRPDYLCHEDIYTDSDIFDIPVFLNDEK